MLFQKILTFLTEHFGDVVDEKKLISIEIDLTGHFGDVVDGKKLISIEID